MTTKYHISEYILQKLEQHISLEKAGLLDGLAGESLYYFYRSELFDEAISQEKAIRKLQQVIEISSSTQTHSNFYNGLAGIGWLICHLNETEIAEIAVEDVLDTSVDVLLYEEMLQFLNTRVLDFFYGASGICFYFLKRYITTQNKALKETYKTYITHFLFYLEYTSIIDENGIYWTSHALPFETEETPFQLSGADTISGLLLVLTEITATNDFSSICKPLLKKSSYWLLHRLQTVTTIRIDEVYCVWKASNILKDESLSNKATELLRETAVNLHEIHASALMKYALIYQKVENQTNEVFFKEKATESFQIVSKQLSEDDLNDASIWKGYAGIGLTALSLEFEQQLDWSNCMLI